MRMYLIIAGVIGGITLILGGVALIDHRGYKRGEEAVRLEWGKAQAEAADRALQREREYAEETRRRYAAQQTIVGMKEKEIADARKDADAAVSVGRSLRSQISRLTAACGAPSDSGAAPGSTTAPSTRDLLADVQRRLDESAERIARYADEASASGRACERSYDALTLKEVH